MGQARDVRDQLVALLRGLPAELSFNDAIGNARFDKPSFNTLADALKAWFWGKVEVELFSPDWFRGKFGGDAGAYYSPANDVFGFRVGFGFGDLYNRSVAVHESIHALQDGRELRYTPPDHEVVAYAGQALYYAVAGGAAKGGLAGRVAKGTAEWKIFEAADRVAAAVAESRTLGAGTAGVSDLRTAIRSHPAYAPKPRKKSRSSKAVQGDGW